MHTVEITLEQVLLARDRRVQRQQALHRQYGGTLLSFTMNIAGPVKDTPLVRLAFQAGLAALDRDLGKPVHRELIQASTGPEALLPQWGIRVEEIPRLEGISASRVRQLLRQGRLAELQPLVPETTYAYCRDHFGAGALCP